MDNCELLIQDLQRLREHMRRVVAQADTNREIYPHWRMKEVLDHLTGWDDAAVASLQAHVDGREPPVPAGRGINDYNARTVSEREALDLRHTIQEWEVTRQQLIDRLHSLPSAKIAEPFIFPWGMNGTVEEIVNILIEHEEEHAAEIEGLLSAEN